MLTTDLGACEWFVWDLRRSNLIDRGQLDQVIGEFLGKNAGAEPPALAEFLVGLGILTDFQAERLLQGKTQGFVLGPFTLMDSLGTGSMGTVYKAQSKNDNLFYAVKVLPRRSMWNVRIARRKVRVFEQLQHPGVVPFIDVGTAGGMHYLAWPMVEGETLDKLIQREGKLGTEPAVMYVVQVAEALELCHQQKIFHGLIKPSNLMLSTEGQVKILDFGIGCLLAETEGESLVDTMSTANSVNSGLDCASPESIMDPSNLSPLGDQYSLGCVLYFLLSGQYPFPDGTAVEKMMVHQHKQPKHIKQLVPDLPDALADIVHKLMEKLPHERYTSCAEVVEKLRPFGATVVHAQRRAVTMTVRSLAKPGSGVVRSLAAAPTAAAPPTTAPTNSLPPRGRTAMPLPPRVPSNLASSAARATTHGATPTVATPARPSTPGVQPRAPMPPRPATPVVAARPAREPEPVPQPEPEEFLVAPLDTDESDTDAPPARLRVGAVAVLLVALVAGALAYLLSSMVPLK